MVGRARVHLAPEALYDDATIGLLVGTDLDHVHFQIEPEEVAGHCQRAAPLPCPELGRQCRCLDLAIVRRRKLVKSDSVRYLAALGLMPYFSLDFSQMRTVVST